MRAGQNPSFFVTREISLVDIQKAAWEKPDSRTFSKCFDFEREFSSELKMKCDSVFKYQFPSGAHQRSRTNTNTHRQAHSRLVNTQKNAISYEHIFREIKIINF